MDEDDVEYVRIPFRLPYMKFVDRKPYLPNYIQKDLLLKLTNERDLIFEFDEATKFTINCVDGYINLNKNILSKYFLYYKTLLKYNPDTEVSNIPYSMQTLKIIIDSFFFIFDEFYRNDIEYMIEVNDALDYFQIDSIITKHLEEQCKRFHLDYLLKFYVDIKENTILKKIIKEKAKSMSSNQLRKRIKDLPFEEQMQLI